MSYLLLCSSEHCLGAMIELGAHLFNRYTVRYQLTVAPAATITYKRLASLISKNNSRTTTKHCMDQMPAELFIGQIGASVEHNPPTTTQNVTPPWMWPSQKVISQLPELNYIWTTFIIHFITFIYKCDKVNDN